MSFFTLYFIAIALLMTSPLKAEVRQRQPSLQILSVEFPPFTYQDSNGEAAGFMSEVLREVLKEMRRPEVRVDFMPWKRAYILASENRNTLIYPVATVPSERDKLFYWLGPKMKRAIWIYALKADAAKLRLKNREGLKGKLVGVTRDYSWGDLLQKFGAKVDETIDDHILILKLAGRRMPYMAMDEDVENATMKLMVQQDPAFVPPALEKIVMLSSEGVRTFGLSKKSNPELLAEFKRAFTSIEKRGVVKKIEARYPELDFVHRGL